MKKFRDLAVLLFFSLSISIIVVGSVYNYYLSPVSHDIIEKELQIADGTDIDNISTILYKEKLIRNPKVFKLYLKINNIDEIKEGKVTLNTNMSAKEIANLLSAEEQ